VAGELKPAGKAVATAKGHYPMADGRHRAIAPGETFPVWEGLTKGKWFTLLPKGGEAPPAKASAPAAPGAETLAAAAKAERQRNAARPTAAHELA
jgi:hypothetical protein